MCMRHNGLLKRHHLVPRAHSFLVTCSLQIKPSSSGDGNEVFTGEGKGKESRKELYFSTTKRSASLVGSCIQQLHEK